MKSEEYLESKTYDNWVTPDVSVKSVRIEHAKTYGKIVELENKLQWYRGQDLLELESEIDKLMKL